MLPDFELITSNSWQTLIFFTCILLAGIVRGCIGFGFSALVIASTALFLNPVLVVPSLILLEVMASLNMLPSIWRDVMSRSLLMLAVGLLIGIPIGVYILSVAPQNILRLIVSGIVLIITLLLLRGIHYKGKLSLPVLVTVGVVSGLCSGIAAAGGLIVATFLSAAQCPMKQVRATMVAFLLVTGVIFLSSAAWSGAFNYRIFYTVLASLVPMFIGVFIGRKIYHLLDERKMRLVILSFLSILSVIGVGRALISFL